MAKGRNRGRFNMPVKLYCKGSAIRRTMVMVNGKSMQPKRKVAVFCG